MRFAWGPDRGLINLAWVISKYSMCFLPCPVSFAPSLPLPSFITLMTLFPLQLIEWKWMMISLQRDGKPRKKTLSEEEEEEKQEKKPQHHPHIIPSSSTPSIEPAVPAAAATGEQEDDRMRWLSYLASCYRDGQAEYILHGAVSLTNYILHLLASRLALLLFQQLSRHLGCTSINLQRPMYPASTVCARSPSLLSSPWDRGRDVPASSSSCTLQPPHPSCNWCCSNCIFFGDAAIAMQDSWCHLHLCLSFHLPAGFLLLFWHLQFIFCMYFCHHSLFIFVIHISHRIC